jgi:alpha-glucosidase (family GH31 glycosyl hydrolase)
VIPVFRRYAKLRERLVPYLTRSAATTIATDRPLMRPLFFDWPDDPAVWRADAQWLLGDDVLAASVVEPGADSRTLYLPAGGWIDVWTGEHVAGGRTLTVDAPIDRIPVFARDGVDDDLLAVFAAED